MSYPCCHRRLTLACEGQSRGLWSATIAGRLARYLPKKLGRPIRTGSHSIRAFGVEFWRWSTRAALDDLDLQTGHRGPRAGLYFQDDKDCRPWEPGGEDCLSPSGQQALLMQQLLPGEIHLWFLGLFYPVLPMVAAGLLVARPASPATARTAGLAHLDGLN